MISRADLERRTGTVRKFLQVEKTMKFEFKRNWIKLLSMIGTSILLYILNLVVEVIRLNRTDSDYMLPEAAIDYSQGYIGIVTLFIYIIGVTFAGSMIAEDFEKSTGNLLFPKIPKHRLLLGRYLARYIYAVCSLLAYYLLVGVTTLIRYSEIPIELLFSFGWAAYFLFAVFAFVTLFSSFFKRTAGATIVSLLVLLIVFSLIQNLLSVTGIAFEHPLFYLTYYSSIISNIFGMPTDKRYVEWVLERPPRIALPGDQVDYITWTTPSELGAGIGILVYAVVLLVAAYFIYRARQNKANI